MVQGYSRQPSHSVVLQEGAKHTPNSELSVAQVKHLGINEVSSLVT